MGQGSCSSSSAPQIVDEEALSHGIPLSKVLWLGRSSLIDIDYGMTLCRRRPTWVKDQAHPAVSHKLWMSRL